MSSKEVSIVLVDVRQPGSTNGPSNSASEIKKVAVDYLSSKLLKNVGTANYKIMVQTASDVGVVFLGSKETKNDLAADGMYSNLEVYDASRPDDNAFINENTLSKKKPRERVDYMDCQIIRDVNDCALNPNFQTADNEHLIIDGLVLAQQLIENKIGKKNTYPVNEIVLIAGADLLQSWGGPSAFDQSSECEGAFDSILEQIAKYNINLKIFGCGSDQGDESHLEQCVSAHAGWQELMKKYPRCTYTACTEKQKLAMVTSDRTVRDTKPTIKGKTDLLIGFADGAEQVRIPLYIYTKCLKYKLPTLKRGPSAKWMRVYRREDDASNELVDEQDATRGYRYGNQIIPIHDSDKEMFNFGQPKTLQMLCSLKREKLLDHWLMECADYITPDKDTESALFDSLAQAMFETDSVILCRYVKRENSKPQICCLHAARNPEVEKVEKEIKAKVGAEVFDKANNINNKNLDSGENGSNSTTNGNNTVDLNVLLDNQQVHPAVLERLPNAGNLDLNNLWSYNRWIFYLSIIPFYEDVRDWPFPELPKMDSTSNNSKTKAQVSLTDDLVDEFSINKQFEDFDLEKIKSPTLEGFHNLVLARVLDKKAPVADFLRPCFQVRTSESVNAKEFKEKFDLTKLEKIGGKKKKYWKEDDGDRNFNQASVVTRSGTGSTPTAAIGKRDRSASDGVESSGKKDGRPSKVAKAGPTENEVSMIMGDD